MATRFLHGVETFEQLRWVDLKCVIAVYPDYTHLLFERIIRVNFGEILPKV